MSEYHEPLLAINNLRVKRGNRIVLKIEELNLYRGEVLALVGPNAAGKSTLLLTIARLIPLFQGKIIFKGISIDEWDDLSYRRQMSMVFQDSLLLKGTVMDNVTLGLRFRGVSKSAAAALAQAWLERLRISELSHNTVSQLSGGEAQRVSIARALVLDPLILLLDEPFSSLDPPSRLRLQNDLANLLKENQCTTLFITHHLKEATKLGDRVAVMVGGTLRQTGTMEDIMKHPVDEEVAAFINSDNA